MWRAPRAQLTWAGYARRCAQGGKLVEQGEGSQLLHHKAGDAMFRVVYLPHKSFKVERNGVDLLYEAKIMLVDALLGFRYRAVCVRRMRPCLARVPGLV